MENEIINNTVNQNLNNMETKSTTTNQNFPIHVFPENIQKLLLEAKMKLSYAIEILASAILAAISIVCGNRVRVRCNNNFIESCSLYIAIVAPAGAGKTPPLKLALKAIYDLEDWAYKKYKVAQKEYEENKEANEAMGVLPPKNNWRLILGDFTPESLLLELSNNSKGVLVHCDELKSLFENLNRYTRGSAKESLLSIWSHVRVIVTRKNSDSLMIPLPFMSIIGGIQTQLVSEMLKPEFLDSGLSHRFLYVMYNSQNPMLWTENNISDSTYDAYVECLEKIYNLPYDNEMSTIIGFSDEGMKRLLNWQNKEYSQILKENEDESYCGAYRKMDIYVLRFSLILQLSYYAAGEDSLDCINLRAVEGAIDLANYFMEQVKSVHELVIKKDYRLGLSDSKLKFFEALPQRFSMKEARELGLKMDMTKDMVKKFVLKKDFFSRIGQKGSGIYEKIDFNDEDRIHL